MNSSREVELDWLKHWSTCSPEKEAFLDVESGRRYSWSQVYRISNGLALNLQELGVHRGDRVAVLSQNKIETVFLFFALQRLGAILVPINFRLSSPEVDYILKDSGSTLLLTEPGLKPVADQLNTKVTHLSMETLQRWCETASRCEEEISMTGDFESPVKILYTSGTTGFPKGVVITHKILFWNSVNTTISLNLTSEDCMVSFLPLFHTGGWNVLLTPFIHRGGRTVFLKGFDGDQVLNLCDQEKATLIFGVPTTLSMMSKSDAFEKVSLNSVRYAIVGGEPMPLGLIRQWHQKGVSVRQGFGLTECGPNCFSLSETDAESKIGSIGRPNFYVATRIVDENDNDVKPGQVGELLLKGPMCMTGYWQNPEATQSGFLGHWLKTGDLVRQDEEGYFYVVGRKKEMFISGGENVYPAEVEKVLSQHEALDEVAVIGWPDEKWGEVGKAYLVPKPGKAPLSNEEIASYCGSRLARFKVPKHIEWLEELPKGATGKILKRELAAQT